MPIKSKKSKHSSVPLGKDKVSNLKNAKGNVLANDSRTLEIKKVKSSVKNTALVKGKTNSLDQDKSYVNNETQTKDKSKKNGFLGVVKDKIKGFFKKDKISEKDLSSDKVKSLEKSKVNVKKTVDIDKSKFDKFFKKNRVDEDTCNNVSGRVVDEDNLSGQIGQHEKGIAEAIIEDKNREKNKGSKKIDKISKFRNLLNEAYKASSFNDSRAKSRKMRSKTITFGNNLSRYLSEINKQETLSDKEEIELSKLIKKGDKDAFHKLIKGNLRFVVSIAKQYNNRGLSFDELVSEGNIGLIKGVQRYDESQGVKFISYAVWWIRQGISTSLSEGGRIIRLPVNKVGLLNNYVIERNKLIQKLRREPTLDELAEALNVSEKELNSIISNYGFPVNADSAPRDDDNFSFISILADENDTNLTDKRDSIAFNDDLSKILSKLSNVESEVIRCFFGTPPYQAPKTLDEIGGMLGLTRERVRQIKEKAISNIHKYKLEDKLRPYINKNFGSV